MSDLVLVCWGHPTLAGYGQRKLRLPRVPVAGDHVFVPEVGHAIAAQVTLHPVDEPIGGVSKSCAQKDDAPVARVLVVFT